jgi:NodT family efflux transporter outer membrane factor (OMF) lipoprotein
VVLPEKFILSGEAPLADRWWTSFEDAHLNLLVERALRQNFNLRAVWDRLDQAQAVARAAGAPLLPSLEGRAAAARSAQRTDSAATGAKTVYRSNLSFGLYASYEIDLWGRIASRREAAELDLKVTEEQLQAAAITLSAAVAAVWYDLAEQQGHLALLREQLQLNEEMLELVTLRFRQGLTGAADVLQQRQLIETRRGDMVVVEARIALLTNQLAILQGANPGEAAAKQGSLPAKLPAMPKTGLPASLIERRPDVRAAYYSILAADRRVATALTERFPRISLAATVETAAGNVQDLFSNWLASLAANLLQPLFDAGARRAEVERVRGVAAERLNLYGQTILTALGEVEDALAQEQQQVKYLQSLDRQLDLSRQVIERTRHGYLHGATDFLRVLDHMQRHQGLERQRLTAQRQLIQHRINLYRSLGGGWEIKRPDAAHPKRTLVPTPKNDAPETRHGPG